MSKVKRLRIFAGPNGSGKSSLFDAFERKGYHIGHFVNSDLIEKEIREKGFIDLTTFDISASQADLSAFFETEDA